MAKFYGAIGFAQLTETAPGIWDEHITEHMYSGDMNRNSRALQASDSVNDDITISNEISIISDPFADQNFYNMRYVKIMGTKWKIKNAEVKYPRLILTIGGLYNG